MKLTVKLGGVVLHPFASLLGGEETSEFTPLGVRRWVSGVGGDEWAGWEGTGGMRGGEWDERGRVGWGGRGRVGWGGRGRVGWGAWEGKSGVEGRVG